jgi:hypothetical protein
VHRNKNFTSTFKYYNSDNKYIYFILFQESFGQGGGDATDDVLKMHLSEFLLKKSKKGVEEKVKIKTRQTFQLRQEKMCQKTCRKICDKRICEK